MELAVQALQLVGKGLRGIGLCPFAAQHDRHAAIAIGDNSGTHQKENEIWRAAGRTPGGAAYIQTKAFMTASMRRANDEGGYFLTDSSTFIAERRNMPQLRRLFRGGEILLNPYHTLYLTQPNTGDATARRFGAYLLSEPVQALLRDFGRDRYGEAMYNDAATTAQQFKAKSGPGDRPPG